jgi:UDP-glucose 4-epimerase
MQKSAPRALVTGGRGYLGRPLAEALVREGYEVTRLSRSPKDGRAAGNDIVGDVRDPEVVAPAVASAAVVFHLAAQTSAAIADQDPITDQAINVLPLLLILEECARAGHHPVVVFASTVTVCGVPAALPVNESHPDAPLTIYDLHKSFAESYLRYYVRRGVVAGGTLRLANVYGPGPASSAADRGILNAMIRKALSGETLTIYGDGRRVRDYVYRDDVVRALILAAAHGQAMNGQHYVIGSGEGHSIADAVSLAAARVLAKTGTRAPVVHAEPSRPESPIERRNFVADSSRFSELSGWKPMVKLVEGIDRTIDFYRAHIARR